MEELPLLERDGRPEGEEEDDEVERAGHDQDGQDVHLVGGEVVVEQILLPPVCHQQPIPEELRVDIFCLNQSEIYLRLSPLLELQLETATNHHLSLAVLKFLVPLQTIRGTAPVMFTFILWQPEITMAVVRLMNWLFSTFI